MTLITIVACSTEKNTSQSRWWHSFTAKYNTYYNGSLAYIDGALEKENSNKDNYTEMIPLYTVGNKASREIGKGNFDKAIEKSQKAIKNHSIRKRPDWNKGRKKTAKDIEWLNRKEYNPFLWKAWMMMGRSQFMSGKFDEASSTFAYMARIYSSQPAIYGKARAWLAKSYIEQDWLYDAEDVIKKMQRDSIDWRARKEWDYTMADYYIHSQRFDEAIPYLKEVIKHETRNKQKAREYFLLGQLYAALDKRTEAYKSFRSCIRCNPPYELEFNARISMTEVAAADNAKKMIGKLKRMARNDNNENYLDQVYYAIGNIYLSQKDTMNAIAAYEKGNSKATRNGIEKGVLLLHLGDIYWQQEKYSDARRCYGEAIGLLDKDRKDYAQLSDRSKKLDELVPHTDAIHLNDSLLALSEMPEKERNEAIDRVIEALKKKEKEERDKQAEQEAAQNKNASAGNTNARPTNNATNNNQNQQSTTFYFYNPTAVSQGKQQFQRMWGNRENADDWQRNNKTVVAQTPSGEEAEAMELTEEQRDSIAKTEAMADSIAQSMENPENDPHKREYYMKQIPFEEEQKAECHKQISDGLYNSAVIFKDKFDNLPLSEKQFMRLENDYPDYERQADMFYHLFLLYNRMKNPQKGETYLDSLKTRYPDNEWTNILSDPNFAENALYGKHIEDSLYTQTYDAFKANKFDIVEENAAISAERFPFGYNRGKFIFINGLSKLNAGEVDTCLACMQQVVEKHPKSEVAPLAGMIINGVKAGRQLHGGQFDIGNIWTRRTSVMADSDSIAARKFVDDLKVPYTFMFAYAADSVENENKLLFELARFNFTTFVVRNFEISIEEINGLRRMKVSGFRSYQEARQYVRQLYEMSSEIPKLVAKARPIIISNSNIELLGTQYSYDDYEKFYEQHYVPLKISTIQLLTEPIIEDLNEEKPKKETTSEDKQTTEDMQDETEIIPVETDVVNEETETIAVEAETVPVESTEIQQGTEEKIETVPEDTVKVKKDTLDKIEIIQENVNQTQANEDEIIVAEDDNQNPQSLEDDFFELEPDIDDNGNDDEIIVVMEDEPEGGAIMDDGIIVVEETVTDKEKDKNKNNDKEKDKAKDNGKDKPKEKDKPKQPEKKDKQKENQKDKGLEEDVFEIEFF